MNFRKFKKSTKALSPVVASIILIAVTVAVSVVVAAWMGGMTIGLMGNAEQLSVTNVEFVTGTTNSVKLSIQNNGGADASITKIYVNGASGTGTPTVPYTAIPTIVEKGAITDVTVNLAWVASTSYEIKFTTANGNNVVCTEVSPVA